jgi:hypothetical protein
VARAHVSNGDSSPIVDAASGDSSTNTAPSAPAHAPSSGRKARCANHAANPSAMVQTSTCAMTWSPPHGAVTAANASVLAGDVEP